MAPRPAAPYGCFGVEEVCLGLVQDVAVWWAGQMRDLLPARLFRAEDRGDAVIATLRSGGSTVLLSRRRRGGEVPLGEITLDAVGATEGRRLAGLGRRPPRTLIRLSPAEVLERPVTLPLATEPELDRVLAYELDRLSPFATAEVFWTYAVERRDSLAGQVHLRLALVPRAVVAAALETLRAANLPPEGLLAPRADEPSWRFGLDAPGAARPRSGRGALRLAVTACAVLAFVALTLPFLRQHSALAKAEARIAAARPAVDQVEALRRRSAERAGGNDALATEAARLGRPLEGGVATLTGQTTGPSAASARLIAALSADPAIRAAAFAAPVTRRQGGPGELFSIRVEFGL
jgi:general secretion pathway protein L